MIIKKYKCEDIEGPCAFSDLLRVSFGQLECGAKLNKLVQNWLSFKSNIISCAKLHLHRSLSTRCSNQIGRAHV